MEYHDKMLKSSRKDEDYISSKTEYEEERQYDNHVGYPNFPFSSLLKSMTFLSRARKRRKPSLISVFGFSWLYIPGLWVRLTVKKKKKKVTFSEVGYLFSLNHIEDINSISFLAVDR